MRSVTLSRTTYRLLFGGILLWALGGATYAALHAAYGYQPAYVHIRWASSVSTEAREQLAQKYSLTRGEYRESRTWGYYLTDLSTANIRSLVRDPAIEDTHQINRIRFRIWRTAPRLPYTGFGAPLIPRTLELVVLACAALGAISFGLVVLERFRLPAPIQAPVTIVTTAFAEPGAAARYLSGRTTRWWVERIPAISPTRLRVGIAVPPLAGLLLMAAYVGAEALGFRGLAAPEAGTISEAAALGHAARAVELIDEGQDPGARFHVRTGMLDDREHDLEPIEAAILGRHAEMVRLLQRSGAASQRGACLARAVLPEVLPDLGVPSTGSSDPLVDIATALEMCVPAS